MHTLLIVEDDESLRRLYQEEFAEEGYEVRTAASGEEAVALLAKLPVEVVVLDIRMGGIDGLEVLRRFSSRRPDVRVVIHTAYPAFKTNFGSWAADAYVVKSSDLSELKGAVSEVLLRRAA